MCSVESSDNRRVGDFTNPFRTALREAAGITSKKSRGHFSRPPYPKKSYNRIVLPSSSDDSEDDHPPPSRCVRVSVIKTVGNPTSVLSFDLPGPSAPPPPSAAAIYCFDACNPSSTRLTTRSPPVAIPPPEQPSSTSSPPPVILDITSSSESESEEEEEEELNDFLRWEVLRKDTSKTMIEQFDQLKKLYIRRCHPSK